jgi:hypothetical protein
VRASRLICGIVKNLKR